MYYNENTIIYLNGEFIKATDAKTDLYGQSLHYGYAVFEGIKSYRTDVGTRIFKAKEHYERLCMSAKAMHMPFAYTPEQLTNLTYELLNKNGFSDAYIRPIVFCPPNMGIGKASECYLAIEAWEWTNGYLANQMRLMISSYCRPNPGAFLIEAKVSGHYVNSILASQEAKDKGYDEALLLDMNGYLAEGPGANLFFQKGDTLYTPEKGHILPGITRDTVIELCHDLGIKIQIARYKPEDIMGADCGFYCGTAAEIVALASVNDVPFRINWEDSLGALIQKAYRCRVREKEFTKGDLNWELN